MGRYGYPPHLLQALFPVRLSLCWGWGWECIKGAETFDLKLLFLRNLSCELSSWIEPKGFCRVRDIRVGLRVQGIDHSKPDLSPEFKDEKVLQAFCKPREQGSRIKIWHRLYSAHPGCRYIYLAGWLIWNHPKHCPEQHCAHRYGTLKLSSILFRPVRKAPLMFLLTSWAWTVRKPSGSLSRLAAETTLWWAAEV